MTDRTHRHQCRITFRHEDGDETKTFDVYTPEGVTDGEIEHVLLKTHNALCEEKDIYRSLGRSPETLASEAFSCHDDWIWHEHEDHDDDVRVIVN